jgi:peptide/nickel transport system permease protein
MAGMAAERGPGGIGRFLARRLAQAVPVFFGIILFSFFILHLAPGDTIDVLAGEAGTGDAAYLDQLRQTYGLDQPLIVQLGHYLFEIAHFNLGYSIHYSAPVAGLIASRIGPTVLLMGSSIVLSVVVGIGAGTLAATVRNSWLDEVISFVALLAYATPIFWIGLMLVILFSVILGWLPSGGFYDAAKNARDPLSHALDIARHLVLPALTLSLFYFAVYTRLTRASMLEVLGMDYVRTARAKGLDRWRVTWRHVLRNALLPIVTMFGMQAASLLGGAVVVETVFNWPGLGRLTYDAIFQREYQLLIGILLISSALVIVVNICVDLVYSWLDPRIVVQ